MTSEPGSSTIQFAARLRAPVVERLRKRAQQVPQSQTRLVERYIDEGMRMDDHPGIVFRDGPLGRRAGLAAGPDVWEIVAALRHWPERGQRAVAALAHALKLSEGQLQAALGYYGDFSDEVDGLIERNEEATERAELAWRRRQSVLE